MFCLGAINTGFIKSQYGLCWGPMTEMHMKDVRWKPEASSRTVIQSMNDTGLCHSRYK